MLVGSRGLELGNNLGSKPRIFEVFGRGEEDERQLNQRDFMTDVAPHKLTIRGTRDVQMTNKFIIVAICFVVAQTLIISSGYFVYAMIGEVNRKLPETRQIPYFFGDRGKYQLMLNKYPAIFSEYRKYYPDGRLNTAFWSTFVLGMAAMGIVAWMLGLF